MLHAVGGTSTGPSALVDDRAMEVAMSRIGEKTIDLSDRARVGPEDESREEQFEGGFRAGKEGEAKPAPSGSMGEKEHGIAESNDLTTP